MKNYRRILLLIGLIGIIAFLIFHNPKVDCETIIKKEKTKSFEGVVIHKFIDSDNHNWKKVILRTDKGERTLFLNWESGGLYNYLKVGDFLKKEKNELKIHIHKPTLDTIYQLEYHCADKIKTVANNA